jgi:Auxiliary Activity family 9 (formerly GH61)
MKTFSLLAFVIPPLVQSHYIFNRLVVDGKEIGAEYDYFRRNSNSYNPAFTADIVNSPDLRCNKGAKPGSTKTYTVAAGTKIAARLFKGNGNE